jgi:arabinofuranosyltransferase
VKETRFFAAASACLAAVYGLAFAHLRLDDAFITLRYSENISRGRGFVFNEGERLLGTTSPGQALVGAALHLVVGHAALPSFMSGIGAVAWLAQAAFVVVLLRPALGAFVALVAGLGVAAGVARSYLFVPLETNLVAALVLGAFVLALRGRWIMAGLVLGFAVVVRADAVLAGAPFALLAWSSFERRPLRQSIAALAPFAAIPTAWGAFAYAYFGSLLPHTLQAKAQATPLLLYAAHLAKLPVAVLPLANGGDSLPLGLLFWALGIGGLALAVRRDPRLAVLPAWGALHAAAYLVLRPDVAFAWHVYPVALVAAVGDLAALGAVVARLPRIPAVAAAASFLAPLAWGTATFWRESPLLYWYGARDAMHREVAAFLREHGTPGDVVDAEEVGTLAYYADLPMIDHAGLVTPFALAARAPAESEGADRRAFHCEALGSLPRLRFVVMNRFELEAHRCLLAGASIAHFQRAAIHDYERPPLLGQWEFWVADRRALAAFSIGQPRPRGEL